MLVVEALDHLAKRSFAYDLDELEPVGNMVTLVDSVVALFVVIAIVDEALLIRGFELELVVTKVKDLLVVVDFGSL